MELLFTSRWYILIIIILVILSLCIKKRESVKEYRVDEILEDGHFWSTENGDPIYIINVQKHQRKKIETIDKIFLPGYRIREQEREIEYEIVNQIYRLPEGTKNQRWFKLKVICQKAESTNNGTRYITYNFEVKDNSFLNSDINISSDTISNEYYYDSIVNKIENNREFLIQKGIPPEEIEELKSNRSKKLIFNFVKKFSEILVEIGMKEIIEKYYS